MSGLRHGLDQHVRFIDCLPSLMLDRQSRGRFQKCPHPLPLQVWKSAATVPEVMNLKSPLPPSLS